MDNLEKINVRDIFLNTTGKKTTKTGVKGLVSALITLEKTKPEALNDVRKVISNLNDFSVPDLYYSKKRLDVAVYDVVLALGGMSSLSERETWHTCVIVEALYPYRNLLKRPKIMREWYQQYLKLLNYNNSTLTELQKKYFEVIKMIGTSEKQKDTEKNKFFTAVKQLQDFILVNQCLTASGFENKLKNLQQTDVVQGLADTLVSACWVLGREFTQGPKKKELDDVLNAIGEMWLVEKIDFKKILERSTDYNDYLSNKHTRSRSEQLARAEKYLDFLMLDYVPEKH